MRGKELIARMSEESGGLLTTAAAADLVGISPGALRRRKNKSILAVPAGGNRIGWPAFQFESKEVLEGVARTLKKLGVQAPWMQVSFFLVRLDELDDRRPIDLIKAGEIEPVERAASHFGEHGAA